MKRILIILAGCLLVAAALVACQHRVVMKLTLGTARVLSPQRNVTVRIDGQIQPSIKCFETVTILNGQKWDLVYLWIPDEKDLFGRDIIGINLTAKKVGIPNSSNMDYDLLWGYLIQSESGEGIASFDGKLEGPDPMLEINHDHVQFVVTTMYASLIGKTIEIVVNQKDA